MTRKMETSTEEIQSRNEALATMNEELSNRNAELGQTNNELLNLLASVEMAIVMIGPDLRIRRFTPAAEKLLELVPADVGRPICDLELNVDLPDIRPLLDRVLISGETFEQLTKDQRGNWFSVRFRPYRTLADKVEGVVIVFVDVDTLERNEERIRRQADLLEQAHDPILTWTLDGAITFWNRGAEKTYGFTRKEALGRSPQDLLSSDTTLQDCRRHFESAGTWQGEIQQKTKSGEKIVVESRMSLMTDPDGTPVVLETVRPITERKKGEETLRLCAQDLLAADRAKNEFLAMLAHELRNPLAALHNAVQVIRVAGHDEDAIEHARVTMERQTQNMVRMVEDLLETSRVSQGKIDLHREIVDLTAIVRRAVDATGEPCQLRGQSLDVDLPDEPVPVEADSTRLEQVFANLIRNASKFTHVGGHVRISMKLERVPPSTTGLNGRSEAVVSVRDDGIGLEPAMLDPIFDIFVQADASVGRGTGGLGIGLTLVRKLVDLHGGSVHAFSDGLGHGSEFVVRLPLLGPETRPALTGTPHPLSTVAPLRILVVDDNRDSGEMMGLVLRLSGHEVRTVDSGDAALEIAREFVPQVVLMDIGMPGMDGYTAGRMLREEMAEHQPLLIAVTGYTQEDHLRRAREAGFDHHLAKPVEIEALTKLLARRRV